MSIVALRIAVEANLQLSSNDLTTILFMSTQGSGFEATCQGCDTTCQGCFVEDNTLVPTCAEMFEHAHSKNGRATIEGVIVDLGYWRVDNKSENVLPCYNPKACRGGLTGDPGYCNDGYQGPCESPAINWFAHVLRGTCLAVSFVGITYVGLGSPSCATLCPAIQYIPDGPRMTSEYPHVRHWHKTSFPRIRHAFDAASSSLSAQ